MKKLSAALALALVFFMFSVSVSLASSSGQACKKAGSTSVMKTKGQTTSLVCTKIGKKLIWKPLLKTPTTPSSPVITTEYIDRIDTNDSTLHSISVNGGPTRNYYLHVPASNTSTMPMPLMVVLHGRSWTATNFRKLSQFDVQADSKNFIVAYPDGNDQQWNAGNCCSFSMVDDVSFIAGIIDSVSSKFNIDKTRVGVFGWSNGAMMAFRAACELSDRVTSIGVGAGSFVVDKTCRPAKPASVIAFHGTEDSVLPIVGFGSFLSPIASAGKYASSAGCTTTSATTWSCPGGGEIKLFIQEGVEHYSQAWWAEMASFMMSHPRN